MKEFEACSRVPALAFSQGTPRTKDWKSTGEGTHASFQLRVLEGCAVKEPHLMAALAALWGMPSGQDTASIDDAVSSLKGGLYKVSCQGRLSIAHSHLTRRDRKTVPNQAGK